MQMQSSLWYDHFSGATYPLNLEECALGALEKKQVKSLAELAAAFIVKDSSYTVHAIQILPQELCITLLKEALESNRDRAMSVLLAHWPCTSLKVRHLAPDIHSSLKLLHDHDFLVQAGKQGLRYTTCVAQNFLETLKKKSDCKLKFVDMTGYPTAEIITYYLATHCMLAHNERKQNYMIMKYEEAIKLIPDRESRGLERFTADMSMRDDSFGIKFDVFLTSEHALNEVCKALKVSSFTESTLRLFVEKLDATCLGKQKVEILLEQLDPEHLKGLRLKYNSLSSADFISLCPQLDRFTNLTALDFSCNCINVYQNDSACDRLSQLLSKLPQLIRLDLSNNRIKSKVRRLLSNIQKPLEYLRLVGCGLMLADMIYLSVSHHAAGLQELDLSENNLGLSIQPLISLLRASRAKLKVLELEECSVDVQFLSLLSACFLELTGLMYLNISGNPIILQTVESVVQSVATLPHVQWLVLMYPHYETEIMDDDLLERTKLQFNREMNEIVINQRKSLNFTNVLSLVIKERNTQ